MPDPEKEKIKTEVIKERADAARTPILNSVVRDFILNARGTGKQLIDESPDKLLTAEWQRDSEKAKEEARNRFREFINENRDRIDALSIIYNQDWRNRHLTTLMIDDLHEEMRRYSPLLSMENLFRAYSSQSTLSKLIDLIQIIRYEWQQITELKSFSESVSGKFNDWVWQKNANKAGIRGAGSAPFSDEQMTWLRMIRDHIAVNAVISLEDLGYEPFSSRGGAYRYYNLFGDQYEIIITELNEALVA